MASRSRTLFSRDALNRRGFLQVLVASGGAALLSACQSAAPAAPTQAPKPAAAPTSAPAPKAAAPAPTGAAAAAPAAAPAPADWDELVRLAKQDGEVVISMGRAASRQISPVFKQFEEKFGVKVTGLIGSGTENAQKVTAERDTGLFTVDVWMGGLTSMNTQLVPRGALDPIAPYLVLPEVKDEKLWFGGKHLYGDKDQKLIFLFAASPTAYLAYNTNMVKVDEIQSWWDLLDPKWKGKIVGRDPTVAGTGGSLLGFYFTPSLGKDFLTRLYTEQQIVLTKDGRQGAEWLALGKYPLYFIPSGSDPEEAKAQGLPVDTVVRPMKEGAWITSGGTGTISPMSKSPHPNATKLFINWWLSKEAQLAYMKNNPLDESLREDISKDDVDPDYRRKPGVNYMHLDSDQDIMGKDGEPNEFMKKVIEARG
jgi:iron(III) transport system substrate-binding protein